MNWMLRLAVNRLKSMSPREAAEWLTSLNQPQVQQVIDVICHTPDEQLMDMLAQIGQQHPDYAALVAELRQRPEWLVQTIRELRQISVATAHAKAL